MTQFVSFTDHFVRLPDECAIKAPAQFVIVLRHESPIRPDQMQKAGIAFGHGADGFPVQVDDESLARRKLF